MIWLTVALKVGQKGAFLAFFSFSAEKVTHKFIDFKSIKIVVSPVSSVTLVSFLISTL